MKSPAALRFKVEELREKRGLALSTELKAGALIEEPVENALLAGTLAVDLEFSVGGDSILLVARLRGRWRVPCSRCLRETEAEFEASAEETYPLAGETLDAAPAIREAALLELPQRWVCRTGCGGFRAQWGEAPAGSPESPPSPFSALKKLKKKT